MTESVIVLDPPMEGSFGGDRGLALAMRGNGNELLFAVAKKPLQWVSVSEFVPDDIIFDDVDPGISENASEVSADGSPMGTPRRRGRE